jgi:glycosidase
VTLRIQLRQVVILRSLAAILLLTTAALAQNPHSVPRIDKIDPPDWFVALPEPMLLLHGAGLDHAQFTVQATGVSIARTEAAPNGHWAFLWLHTAHAAPQHITITAANASGRTTAPFQLRARPASPAAHAGFSSHDVIYLVMTDRFADGNPANNQPDFDRTAPRGWHGGDLAGLDQHLDYLQSLGVTALWTTPVASNAGMSDSYHGYAATDLYAVDSHFGTLDDYRKLSADLHSRRMKLIIDLVPNHIGVHHPWVDDPPAPNWLHGTRAAHPAIAYDFHQLIDPHAPPAAWRPITDGWFTDGMPDLNQDNPLVAKYLIQNTLWWIETANLDGIRLDTFPYVSRSFWHSFHAALHGAYPHLTTVGEIFDREPEVTSFFAGGRERRGADGSIDTGLYTPFDFPLFFTLRDVLLKNHPMTEIADVLRADSLYPHPERLVTFFGNHDTARFISEPGSSQGKLRLAFGLIATMRGTPEIYSGDEIAMPGGADPDNRRDFPGGFPGDPASAFKPSDRTPIQQAIFTWVRDLLQLRSHESALTDGDQQNIFADNDSIVYVRGVHLESGCTAGERILIAATKAEPASSGSVQFHFATASTALANCAHFTPLFSVSSGSVTADSTALTTTLPADGFAIVRAAE